MSYIGNQPLTQAQWNVYDHTVTATTTYTIPGGYTVGFLTVILNGGVLQSSDFTANDGATLVLNNATVVGDSLTTISIGTFETASLAPNSIQDSHIDIDNVQAAGLMPTAWCVFNGDAAGTNAPTDGYNVTSVTRVAGGQYTLNLTSALDNTTIVAVGGAQSSSGINLTKTGATTTTVSVNFRFLVSGNLVAANPMCVLIFGGKN